MKGPAFSQLSDLPLPLPAQYLWCLVLVAWTVVILPTCLPSCELLTAWDSVFIVSVPYSLSRALLPQPYLFVEDRSFLYVSGSLQTGHAVPIPTLTSSAESDTSQGLEGICSFCGLSPRENFEGVCGPFLDH